MIIDGFNFEQLKPSDLMDSYAVTIYVNGFEMSTELVTSMAALIDRISDLNHIILAGDEILLHVQAPSHLRHITGKYTKDGGSNNAKAYR